MDKKDLLFLTLQVTLLKVLFNYRLKVTLSPKLVSD